MTSFFSSADAIDHARRLHAMGHLEPAYQLCRNVLRKEPESVDALSLTGVILLQSGDAATAVKVLQKAISLHPAVAELYVTLAPAMQAQGRADEALAAARKAVSLKPGLMPAHLNLAQALQSAGRFAEAEASAREAAALDARDVGAHIALAAALHSQSKLGESIEAARRATELAADFHVAWNTLGTVQTDAGELDAAIASFDRAIGLQPQAATAHYHRAMALLAAGRLREGFAEYEWRWRCPADGAGRPNYTQPLWDGSALANQTFLLHAEQGLGDTLQFIRYLPLVRQRAANIIIAVQPELVELLQDMPGRPRVVTITAVPPPFDVHRSLASLPHVLGTEFDSIPATVPYLAVNPKKSAEWKSKLATRGTERKIGLVWAGSPLHRNDRNRSIDPGLLLPLLDQQGAQFFSLQKSAAPGGQPLGHPRLVDLSTSLATFTDTAAVLSHLDMVICIDTSVAHLAGALGKRVWLMLPYSPDWRWMRDRTDSPWYPTMRLFRQPEQGAWAAVIESIRAELGRFCSTGVPPV